jgi:hypothetical protein
MTYEYSYIIVLMKKPMKKYVILTFFLFVSVYLTTLNINPVNAADSVENFSKNNANTFSLDSAIILPLSTACVFDDGELPKVNPDDCDPISNNEDSLGSDNILFTLDSSPQLFDSFFCTLKDQNGVLVVSGECFKSNTIAEEEYRDLADGTYTFTVTASRIVNDSDGDNTDDITQTATSPEFDFVVGIGSDGGSDFGGGEDPLEPGAEDAAPGGNVFSSSSQFKKLLQNEKVGFLNLENKIKTNEVINTTSLACTFGKLGESLTIYHNEFNCDRLLIFASQPPNSSSDSNTSKHNSPYLEDMYIYKVNNALSNGISGSLIYCGISRDAGSDNDNVNVIEIKPIPCNEIFVAYELLS